MPSSDLSQSQNIGPVAPDHVPDDRAASRVLLLSRLFAAVAMATLIAWPLIETQVPNESVQLVVDLALPLVIGLAVFLVVRRVRMVVVRGEQKKRLAAEAQALYDDLSGLYNRRYFRERLHVEHAEASRDGAKLALVLFDLDNFKDINDRFGHAAGDAVIAAAGEAMRQALAGRGVGARQGGDEFAALLPAAGREDADAMARAVADRISRESAALPAGSVPRSVTATFGIAIYPDDAGDAGALAAAADRALYRAKSEVYASDARTEERYAQDVFFAIGDAIRESPDPTEVVQNLSRAVGTSLKLDACSVWMVRPSGNLRPRAYFVRDQKMVAEWERVLREAPLSRREAQESGLMRGQPLYVDDMRGSFELPRRYAELLAPDTWLVCVPMPGPQEGVLMLAATHERAAPPATGLALAIARLAGAAIGNAEIYRPAARQGEQLAELAGLGGLLLGEGTFEQRLGAVADRIVEITGFDMVTLDTPDPTDERPFARGFAHRASAGHDLPPDMIEDWIAMRPALSEPGVQEFLRTVRDPIVLDDPLNQAGETYRDVIERGNIQSAVIMPVNWQGETNGLLWIAGYAKKAFDAHDIALMHTISAQLAPSIQVAVLHTDLELSYVELKDAHLQALFRLAYAAEARDPYTECHLSRIRAIAIAIGERMRMEGEALESLGYGAIVHDLGKLRIPDSILINPGRLSDAERTEMKRHPQWGAEIIGQNAFYDVAREVALHHHERWDGSGYPFGLQGEAIPLTARIVAVADVYDALTSARPYKAAWGVERSLVELMKMRGKTLCPASVDVFMALWREGAVARIDAETEDESLALEMRAA